MLFGATTASSTSTFLLNLLFVLQCIRVAWLVTLNCLILDRCNNATNCTERHYFGKGAAAKQFESANNYTASLR
eukprot:1266914-Pleurochrysis_carterae.AAC.2